MEILFQRISFNVKGRLIFADENNRGGYKTPKGETSCRELVLPINMMTKQ